MSETKQQKSEQWIAEPYTGCFPVGCNSGHYVIRDNELNKVAFVLDNDNGDEEEVVANKARLIAKAPEMLEAIEEIERTLTCTGCPFICIRPLMAKLKQLITEAKGETP